ncbi:LytR/AlgR family response regulator transcription factor [Bacillus salitolerans]|uniref:LytR/AlgR family response regulator transcription factor n=1 Tax=Bacillus salitolerans TaxID=1437434 RepID=A0ABW4LNI3_9BACI
MIKIIIAEDDLASRKVLVHFIKDLPNCSVVGEAANGEELIQLIHSKKPDVALVDIVMPRLSGLEAVKSCKELVPNLKIIFITGHDDFAIDAFNIDAVDYILKPVERERLYKALSKVIIPLEDQKNQSYVKELAVKGQNHICFIPFDEIIFIEKIERKSVVHTQQGSFETNEPLTEYEGLLDSRFILSHRSYIINLYLLNKIEKSGQMFIAYFKNSPLTARISKHKINDIQELKSRSYLLD